MSDNLNVRCGGIFLRGADEKCYVPVYPRLTATWTLPATPRLLQEARRRGGVLAFDAADSREELFTGYEESRRLFLQHEIQLLVLLLFKGDVIGLIAVGRKESGALFSSDDRNLLMTLANQGALSIANALAYQRIQTLNASLEQKVAERTQELARSNVELQSSLQRLEEAYLDIQRGQETLVRAEKMATLGRLTAGIAHEMNTPLGASLTSLNLLQRLVTEHRAAAALPQTAQRQHQDIDAKMDNLLHLTKQWLDKAVAYIRSLKLHTRDLQHGEERSFSVLRAIEDTGLLLSHRLRLSRCALTVSCTEPQPTLYGDPSKLGQVLTNLIGNAIDAYSEAKNGGGEIRIEVQGDDSSLEIRVSDRGCGIPPELQGRIFDEFFSMKPLGEGAGLGLSIARHLVANFFGGTISVESAPDQGSTFTVRLPRKRNRLRLTTPPSNQ